jgi:phosphatidylinositol glycan class M
MEHTYLYHVGRLDHRHNFSAYFYPIYQAMFSANTKLSQPKSILNTLAAIARHPVSAFIPQMVATMTAGVVLAWRYDFGFACFVQTVIFVTFNKVCTSQVSVAVSSTMAPS